MGDPVGAGFSRDVGLQDGGYFDALARMFGQALKAIGELPNQRRRDLLARLDAVRETSHGFGYGVGDALDELVARY